MTSKICITLIMITDLIWGSKGTLSFALGMGYFVYKHDQEENKKHE